MYETLKEPIIQVYGDLKWFNFNQNNSGGYYIENDEVGSDVYIQAVDAKTAILHYANANGKVERYTYPK